jgi:hypothetical protein
VSGEIIGRARRALPREVGWRTNNAIFIGPVTRTAIMSAGARSRGPIPASNPCATMSIIASPAASSRRTFG